MKILQLRLYRVEKKDIAYNADQSIKSENQLYKISYGTIDWESFKKTIRYSFGYAEVVSVSEQIKTIKNVDVLGKMTPTAHFEYKELEISEEIKNAVEAVFSTPKAQLTPEQKEIEELKQMVKNLSNIHVSKSNVEKPVKKVKEVDPVLAELRVKYEDLYGKAPHHKLGTDKLQKAINEFKPAE